jgi:hypothetical protein
MRKKLVAAFALLAVLAGLGLLHQYAPRHMSRGLPLRVLVICEPALRADLAPPTSRVLGHIADRRVAQFGDEGRLLSALLLKSAHERGDAFPQDEIAWDLVAIYPPGVRWEDALPRSDYVDAPVMPVLDAARQRLAAIW